MSDDPRLRAATSRAAAARAGVEAASQWQNPSLEVSFDRATAPGGDRANETRAELSIPLGWLNDRGPRMTAAEQGAAAAEHRMQSARREVLAELGELFWSVRAGDALVEALVTLEQQTAAVTNGVEKRVSRGEARPLELARMTTELERVRNELDGARAEVHAFGGRLAVRLGLDSTMGVTGDLEAIPLPSDTDVHAAAESSPDVAAARSELASADAQVAAEHRARIPAFSVKAFAERELDRNAAGGALAIDLPVFSLNSGRIADAEARRQAVRFELEAATRAARAVVLAAASSCRRAAAAAGRYRDSIVPSAERSAEVLARTFTLGEVGLLDVIDARRTLAQSRREYVATLRDAHIECLRFSILTGRQP